LLFCTPTISTPGAESSFSSCTRTAARPGRSTSRCCPTHCARGCAWPWTRVPQRRRVAGAGAHRRSDATRSAGFDGDGIVAKAATVNSVLVIMAYFHGGTPPAYTAGAGAAGDDNQFDQRREFLQRASYGQQQLSVTVTPNWVMMGITKPATCDYTAIATRRARRRPPPATTPRTTLRRLSVPARRRAAPRVVGGAPYVGYPHKRGSTARGVHDIDRRPRTRPQLRLLHAAYLDCGAAPIGGTCSVSEVWRPVRHDGQRAVDAFQRGAEVETRVDPNDVGEDARCGQRHLRPHADRNRQRASYAVKIPAAANRTYWIEYRQPIGFDSPLSGSPTTAHRSGSPVPSRRCVPAAIRGAMTPSCST